MEGLINVTVTYVNSPFSFFCLINEFAREMPIFQTKSIQNVRNGFTKTSMSDVAHGQYVAVLWQNRWTRGVVTMESQFLIWLIDYGIYIHPDDKTIYIDLPLEYRKYPTKVFEAAIHGVVPLDKSLSEDCQIVNKTSTSWNEGAIWRCRELIETSTKTYFAPLALMSTNYNDVVLGDLYLEMPGKNIVNLIDELKLWPVFLQINIPVYIQNLPQYFTSRRKHRTCLLKPEFRDIKLQVINTQLTIEEYDSLIDEFPRPTFSTQLVQDSVDSVSESETEETEVGDQRIKNAYRLTAEEMEKYSQLYITIHGDKYNVLNILVNKARDLRMCERYKDLKSVGRGFSFRRSYEGYNF